MLRTNSDIIEYGSLGEGVMAFTTLRGTEPPCRVVTAHQVHGTDIAEVTDPATGRDALEGYDALVTNVPGCAIGVRTADCIPVLLYDSVHRAVAAVHSGWRGTLNRISQKTIFRMQELYGTRPGDLKAVIGPGICRRCFQVGEEVVQYFKGNGIDIDPIYSWEGPKGDGMHGGHHLDLAGENRLLLIESGVPEAGVFVSGLCTYEDLRFYSARREGPACGREVSAIMLVQQ